ncbi:hypothetical protein K466DRAFT_595388 [Polyporus arcularius HHB13444]|uniref:Uncharacterized protein n=1 Tax=Polyporus arcularius HHB13444 TaxID=1314778 RepID=A0A5C3PUY0_9APHY|nr:hypothetical protein K466DRAFT_595388 [Polyporus arcularius HHB13444]
MDPAEPTRWVRAILLQLGLPAELVLEIMELAEYYPTISAERSDKVTIRADQHTRDNYCSALLYLVSPPLPDCREGESWRMKKVTWTIEGHDQGWGGDHPRTFIGAYSWYEACIFRPRTDGDALAAEAEDLEYLDTHNLYRTPDDVQGKTHWDLVPNGDSLVWRVQGNRVAKGDFERYVVEWKAGEEIDAADAEEHGRGTGAGFLDALKPGDRVGLWMRALYPGWSNTIRGARVELMYDVR